MRQFSLILGLMLLALACHKPDDWTNLKTELLAIQEQDQRYRKQMDSLGRLVGWQSDAVEQLYDKQRLLDSANLNSIERIIDEFGYPSKEHVGELSIVPFEVIEHCSDSVKINHLELILGAGAHGDIPMRQVAVFQDKILLAQRQPQEYGTQIWIEFIENQKTGERYDSVYLWPVRNVATVDQRRHEVGLDSIAIQLRRFNIDPKKGYVLKKSTSAPL